MNARQHAKILTQYLFCLTLEDLSKILKANDLTIYAQMNLGLVAQLEAHKKMWDITEEALKKVSRTDIDSLETVIEYMMEGEDGI